MDDDYFEENDNLLDEDDALDYILYEKMTKETGGKPSKNTGCLTSIVLIASGIGCLSVMAILILF